MNEMHKLQKWFEGQCDGDWEHEFGIKIETIDNPGWKLVVPLERTILNAKNFETIDIERTESNWIYCEKKELKFYGYGGTNNLSEIISIFLGYVERDK